MTVILERKREVTAALAISGPTLQRQIINGTFLPPVKIGRLSRWERDGTQAIIAARRRGASDEELKQLVRELIAARTTPANQAA